MKLAAAVSALAIAALWSLPPSHVPVTLPNVVQLTTAEGSPRGSGVVIAPGRVLTASHMDQDVVMAMGLPIQARFDHPDLDLALLVVPGIEGRTPFGALPRLHDQVIAVGWHMGRLLMRTDGYQSNVPGRMSAQIIHGCSGGAVVNDRGYLVGIIVRVEFAPTPFGDHSVVPHLSGYTPLTPEAIEWINHL